MLTAVGLMSGTSMDGVDAALVVTDGRRIAELGPATTVPYGRSERALLRACLGGRGPVGEAERAITEVHAAAVRECLALAGREAAAVDVVGFHGHTVLHDPDARRTWQIGDGAMLARLLGIEVVQDFRSADVAAGGQGAPLAPLYHAALARDLARPLAVLNVGGVANVTWIGAGEDDLLAFDTGPGNALVDDFVEARTGAACDRDGALAAAGQADESIVAAYLCDPYFSRPPPKSLDRAEWDERRVARLSTADGAATLTAFTAAAVARAGGHLPAPPERWLVTGGGRHNPVLMAMLRQRLEAEVDPVEAVGWDGDALEAQAFGFLAVRAIRGLPLSVPGTTGVPAPLTGGRRHAGAGATPG